MKKTCSIGGDILEVIWTHPDLGSGVFSPKCSEKLYKRFPRKIKKKLKKLNRWPKYSAPYLREVIDILKNFPVNYEWVTVNKTNRGL